MSTYLFDADAMLTSPKEVGAARANTPVAEVAFMPAPELPDVLVAIVEPFPGQFMVGFRSDVYTREHAAEVTRLVVGPFVDRTDEVTAQVTL